MVTATELQTDIQAAISNGTQCCIRYFNILDNNEGDYDDDKILAVSGSDFWTSGLIMPISSKDAVLVQQGLLRNDDKVLYVLGTVQTSGTLKIGIGSPGDVTNWFGITENGVKTWQLGETDVYKKMFLRRLTNGSLFGE